jgi:hypothetical protein
MEAERAAIEIGIFASDFVLLQLLEVPCLDREHLD